jgi:transposase
MRNRAYRSTAVKQVQVSDVLNRLAEGPVWVGVDVGKLTALAVVRDNQGHFERPWKAKIPSELRELLSCLRELAAQRSLVVAMESTGTYGDALRQALTDAGLPVRRVSGKAASDYAEVFDGVPSAHDGKDAAVVAELAAIGKSAPWPLEPPAPRQAEMSVEVIWLDTQQSILQLWLGRLEALLSRHWPEATRLLKLTSGTLLRALAAYGGPAALAADQEAATKLAGWGGPFLKPEKIEAVLESARQTVGVRMDDASAMLVKRCAQQALAAEAQIREAKRQLETFVEQDPRLQAEAQVVGKATACVLRVSLGDPRDYHCGEAYRKAMGLNLKERSSGKHQGKLKITKRGPSLARRWLYFAALRTIQQSPVRSWYEAKRSKDKDRGNGALVAVMRKLALALHVVATRGETFSLERLLPGKPWPKAASCARPGQAKRTKDSFVEKGLSHRPKAK